MAAFLFRQLPRGSQVAVVDSRPVSPTFTVDLGAARKAIETLEATHVPQSLCDAVSQAIDLALTSEHSRREIYIFTDLTAAAWDRQDAGPLRRRLADAAENPILCELTRLILDKVVTHHLRLKTTRLSSGYREISVQTAEKILEHVASGNGDAAAQWTGKHLNAIKNELKDILDINT